MHGPSFALPTLPAPPVAMAIAPSVPAPPKRPARPSRLEPPPAPPSMVLTYLRLHWMAILFCGTLLGSVLGYAAYSLMPVKYESRTILRVSSTPFTMAAAGDTSKGQVAFATYVKDVIGYLASDTVLTAAYNDPVYKIASTETLKGQEFPLKFLEEKLVIRNPDNSQLITVSLDGAHPDDLPKILDAVTAALDSQVVERDVTLKKAELQKFQALVVKLRGGLNDLAQTSAGTRANFFSPGGVPTPNSPALVPLGGALDTPPEPQGKAPVVQAGAAMPGGISAAIEQSEKLRQMQQTDLFVKYKEYSTILAQLPAKADQLRAAIAAGKKALAEATAPRAPSEPSLDAVERGDAEVQAKFAEARRLEAGAQRKQGISNDPNSAGIRAMFEQARQAKAEAEQLRYERAAKFEQQQTQPQLAVARRELAKLEADLAAVEAYLPKAEQNLKQAATELTALPPDPKRPDEKAAPIVEPQRSAAQTQDAVFRGVTRRVMELEIELDAPKRVTCTQPASKARPASGKKQQIMAAAAVALGFALVALGSVGYELRARKVSSLADLAGLQAAPVVGVVPHTPDAVATDPMRRADLVEAVDKLRARVCQEWLGRGPATLVVTASVGEEGQAFTAFRLATSLAQAGLRTLLVDFDLRSPGLHLLAGVPNVGGVADILRGTWDERAGQIVLPSGLSFLPAGEWGADGPADRPDPLSSAISLGAALDPMLNKLRANVDCLVLAAHPILMSADSVELARRADAVLVCATYRETVGPLAKRACERVAQMSGPAPALVYLGATREEALC